MSITSQAEEVPVTALEVESAIDKFDAPLYTQAEASRYLGLPESTFRNWSRGYHSVIRGRDVCGQPVITAVGKVGQRVFTAIVKAHLQRIVFGADGFASLIPLPGFEHAELVADVRRSFGQPVFAHGGARLEDALALFRAGEELSVVAEEYGIPYLELEDAVRQVVKSN